MTPTETCRRRVIHGRPGVFPRPGRSWCARLAGLLHRLPATIAGLRRSMTALRALVLICHGGIPPRSRCEGLPSPSPPPSKSGAADPSRKAVRLRDVKKRAAFFYRVMTTGTKRCYPCGRADRRAASCSGSTGILIRREGIRRGARVPGAGPASERRYSLPRRRPPHGGRRARPLPPSLPTAPRSS